MTTYTLEREDTGEFLDAYQVLNEVTRLDGAATEAPVQSGGWTPNPDYYIPAHIVALLRPITREQLDAEDTPAAGAHIPGCDDLREQIRLTHASGRLVTLLEAKAQLWHEVASQAWASQGDRSRISERYTRLRAMRLSDYERECEAIKAGLSRAPVVEYGGHTYDEARGFVSTGSNGALESISRSDGPPPPDNRDDVERMRKRVNGGLKRVYGTDAPSDQQIPLGVGADAPTEVGGRWRSEFREFWADVKRLVPRRKRETTDA